MTTRLKAPTNVKANTKFKGMCKDFLCMMQMKSTKSSPPALP